MPNPTGFLQIERKDRSYRPVEERLKGWNEFVEFLPPQAVSKQAERCMDCGIPFCHSGCPVNNLIPDWNDLVRQDDWATAIDRLHATNNFPEFTGRICPAPCEAACTLNIEDSPVTIKTVECEIVDRAWRDGLIKPLFASKGTGKRVAVVGSGPAGLACAQQLARLGHDVTVFEKNDRVGGLLRYGIPDFKLDKGLIDRRVTQMQEEGVLFRTNVNVGVDITIDRLLEAYDSIVLAGGAEQPRDLPVPGRELPGVHYAMDFLRQQNKRVAGDDEAKAAPDGSISALGKHVVVIGGGDTGSDCIGTSNRHGAVSITQLEIMPEPPARENKQLTWPHWPLKMRTSSSQEEGATRDFAVTTVALEGDGRVERLRCARVEMVKGDDGRMTMQNVPGSEFDLKADLVLLAMGFTGSPVEGLLGDAGIDLLPSGTVKADFGAYASSRDRVFACGDMRRGQSLVVWAIREGRDCAAKVHERLMAEG